MATSKNSEFADCMEVGGRATQDAYMDIGGRATQEQLPSSCRAAFPYAVVGMKYGFLEVPLCTLSKPYGTYVQVMRVTLTALFYRVCFQKHAEVLVFLL